MTAPNVVVFRCREGCDTVVNGPDQQCISCALSEPPTRPPLRLVRAEGRV